MRTILAFACIVLSVAAHAAKPIVIAHRGASGYVPEHTLEGYRIAIEMGADFIEPDLVMTKDGVLVARHENEIGATTDVATLPEFARHKKTKTIDGASVTGWFTEDFTLAELKTLRAKERIPKLRPAGTRFDGMLEVPTFEEILRLLKKHPGVGVYPELKHPAYFASIGLPMEEALLRLLGNDNPKAFIQSFEAASLKKLAKMTRLPLVQLLGEGKPYDLADIATYAQAIGVHKNLMIPLAADGSLGAPTTRVRDAHARRLLVHGWTFRAENYFLPKDFRSGDDERAKGDLEGELERFLALGMDGFFIDQPDIGVRALK
jgi:glycerophosphoryl diester phosphodiesterase